MPAYQSITEAMVAERVASLTQELQQLEQAMDKDKNDPLLQIKQQEVDLRALDLQRKFAEHMDVEERKMNEFSQSIDLDRMKREDAEDSAKERIRVADEKLDVARAKAIKDMNNAPD